MGNFCVSISGPNYRLKYRFLKVFMSDTTECAIELPPPKCATFSLLQEMNEPSQQVFAQHIAPDRQMMFS